MAVNKTRRIDLKCTMTVWSRVKAVHPEIGFEFSDAILVIGHKFADHHAHDFTIQTGAF